MKVRQVLQQRGVLWITFMYREDFLDVQKASDTVWRNGLRVKLWEL